MSLTKLKLFDTDEFNATNIFAPVIIHDKFDVGVKHFG